MTVLIPFNADNW